MEKEQLFIQQCFLGACYVLGTIQAIGHIVVNKIKSLASWSPHSNGENKQTKSSQTNQNRYNEKDVRNTIKRKKKKKLEQSEGTDKDGEMCYQT